MNRLLSQLINYSTSNPLGYESNGKTWKNIAYLWQLLQKLSISFNVHFQFPILSTSCLPCRPQSVPQPQPCASERHRKAAGFQWPKRRAAGCVSVACERCAPGGARPVAPWAPTSRNSSRCDGAYRVGPRPPWRIWWCQWSGSCGVVGEIWHKPPSCAEVSSIPSKWPHGAAVSVLLSASEGSSPSTSPGVVILKGNRRSLGSATAAPEGPPVCRQRNRPSPCPRRPVGPLSTARSRLRGTAYEFKH